VGWVAGAGAAAPLPDTTIAANLARGPVNGGGTITTRDTITAGNLGADVLGNIGSLGHNLIQNPTGGSGFALSDILNMNPHLLPLAFNGGPTQTLALGFRPPPAPNLSPHPPPDACAKSSAPPQDPRRAGVSPV